MTNSNRKQGARGRISPATLIASAALFFSVAGTGFAASHYLITSVHQIKPSVRHALRGKQGPQGAQGVIGPQQVTYVQSAVVSIAPNSALDVTALCPSGSKAIGGGWRELVGGGGPNPPSANTSVHAWGNSPSSQSTWVAQLQNDSTSSVPVYAIAACLP